jgi:hypothetical protein
MTYLHEDCDRCDGERYLSEGATPCPRCNPAVARLDLDDSSIYFFAGPVEVEVGDLTFDVEVHDTTVCARADGRAA